MQKLSNDEMKKVMGGTGGPPPPPLVCWTGLGSSNCPVNNCCVFDHQSTGPGDPDGICHSGPCNPGT